MFATVTVGRVSAGSVYKLVAIGMVCGMVPVGLLFGLLALFGAKTVTWNGHHLTGIAGLVGGPLIGAFVAVPFAALIGTVCALGLWLYSLLRPLQITYKAPQAPDAP